MSQKMVIRMLGSKSESEVAKNAGRIGYVVLFYYGRFYSASLTKKTETLWETTVRGHHTKFILKKGLN